MQKLSNTILSFTLALCRYVLNDNLNTRRKCFDVSGIPNTGRGLSTIFFSGISGFLGLRIPNIKENDEIGLFCFHSKNSFETCYYFLIACV